MSAAPTPLRFDRLREVAEAAIQSLAGYLPSHRISFVGEGPGYAPITDMGGLVHYEVASDESRRKGYTPCVKVRIGFGSDEVWLTDLQIDDVVSELLGQLSRDLDFPLGDARDWPRTRIGPRTGRYQGELQLGATPKGNLLVVATFNEFNAAGVVEVEGRNFMLASPAGMRWKGSQSVLRTRDNHPAQQIAVTLREQIAEFDIQTEPGRTPLDKAEALFRLPQFNAVGPDRNLRVSLNAGELAIQFSGEPPNERQARKLGSALALAFNLKPEQLPADWQRYGLTLAATENGAWRLTTLIEGADPVSKAHLIGKSWTVVSADLKALTTGAARAQLAPHLDTLANIRAQMAEADARMKAAIVAFEMKYPTAQARPGTPAGSPAGGDLSGLPVDAQGLVSFPLDRVEFRALSRTLDGGIRVIALSGVTQSSEIASRMGLASNRHGHFKVSPEQWAELPRLARHSGVVNSVREAVLTDPLGQPLRQGA